jgi:hypothetical protein
VKIRKIIIAYIREHNFYVKKIKDQTPRIAIVGFTRKTCRTL